VNHVPDDALEAIDAFGEGILTSEPRAIAVRLRGDLRLEVPCTEATLRASETIAEFRIAHTQRHEALREYGSFVGTIVDGIDERFVDWGVSPPATYERCGERDGWHRYEGTLRF
jgi:hypothetical protein